MIKNNIKTILFAGLIAAMILPFSGMGTAFASTYGSWATPDHDFYCTQDLQNGLFATGPAVDTRLQTHH